MWSSEGSLYLRKPNVQSSSGRILTIKAKRWPSAGLHKDDNSAVIGRLKSKNDCVSIRQTIHANVWSSPTYLFTRNGWS